MQNISKIRFLGLVTLFFFPIPGFLIAHYFFQLDMSAFLQLDQIGIIPTFYGLEFGFVYAFMAYLFTKAPFFETVPTKADFIISKLPLTYLDCILLSVCAGVGEELLFRAGLQPLLGPWITSVMFVALHGYLNPWNWRFSMYGLIVLPFITLLSFGFIHFGLWFAIAAHFAYDAVLFTIMINEKRQSRSGFPSI